MKNKNIIIDYLARVEGEGSLFIKMKDDLVQDVKLKIIEPPRFFEALLRGRAFGEAPDITARICGICPVAYQMSAVHAMEDACQVKVEGQLRALRRLLYCGEWIESHTLHVYMLHAPDFLGYSSVWQMAQDYPDIVQRGLQMKKAGNAIIEFLGGRAVHPVNVRIGGFYKVPAPKEFAPLLEQLRRGREGALETVRWVAQLPFPDFQQNYEFVSLGHLDEYPMNEGRVISNKGLDISAREYDNHFIEEQVPYSNALHSRLKERGAYFTGPLARYNLNFDRLSPLAQEVARSVGMNATCLNPFKSIIVRSIEVLYAFDEALRIIEQYEIPDRAAISLQPRNATGYACTEAPRGVLYHRYTIDEQGIIRDARIIPPTSQNQKTIEQDLRNYIARVIHLPDNELTWKCEQAIRNYDPCLSCATHFLHVHIKHE
ncbi:Ni/Fe hydrogenase subunit alpha [Dictyobacter formicarum]|uniref:Ni/Fe hydrogenase subunit alpha n=1 Tax=Dictyobacter formicarum TaxID=2778368 RepID=A0ABQ3VT09_9CHLR|nr:Ni/Fe hydrogenase subunit alpha [Dictyobacter formicarum]GHO88451.1 Ni/Fe hydrogenase subunit alpha [Dictyobacter formicarum]